MLRKIFLFFLSILLLLTAGLGGWIFYTQARHDGGLRISGLKQPVKVSRDTAGVVHIQAQSVRDAAFALGFSHAQDRSWQLEFNRRLMHGELSEILGEVTLPTDKLMRTLGIRRAAQRQWDNLPAEVRELLQAYSEGITAFHTHRPQGLPPEFMILGTPPGGKSGVAWDPVDSVGWTIMMALDLGGNWGNEFARLAAARVLTTEQLWQLYPPYKGEPPASSVDLAKLYRDLGVYKQGTAQDSGLKTSLSLPIVGEPGFNEGRGSNNWVVAGSHTQSGKPLLANDPHLGLSAPAIWYFAHLQAPGLNVIGATLPGLPFVILGHNTRVAWGFTNTGPDVQDLYLEQIDPNNARRYKTPTGWETFETRVERIAVKDKAAVDHMVRSTRHGPVLSDAQASHGEVIDLSRFVLALRWTALDADNLSLISGLRAPQARNVDELIKAYADNHSPMQNIVMADIEGKIAYKAAGRVPLRGAANDIRGVAPAPGWDARYDWGGWIPYDQTPKDDGQKGWIATANQRITPAGYPHFMGQDWATPHRYERIEQVLNATPHHDITSMQALQTDVVSLSTLDLLPVLRATRSNHPLATAALKQLEGFDGAMRADLAAPLIFAVWADELTRGLIEPKLGEDTFKAQYSKRNFRVLLEQVMHRSQDWWCAPQSCAQQSTAALDRALNRIVALQGKEPAYWRWGRDHVALSSHRPLGQVPILSEWFNVKIESDGDPFTVNVGQYWVGEKSLPFASRHAASMRAIYDLSNLENSVFIYQTGQSGLVWDTDYRNMRQAWAKGKYLALKTSTAQTVHVLKLSP